jgi:hypothetical protein
MDGTGVATVELADFTHAVNTASKKATYMQSVAMKSLRICSLTPAGPILQV